MTEFKKITAAACLALSGVFLSATAHAIPTLRITQGANVETIVDGGAGDINALSGSVVYSGTVGDFVVNTVTGVTKPILGTPAQPLLDLNSINVNGIPSGVITLEFSEIDFTSSGPTIGFPSIIGGVTAGSLRYQTFASLTNTAFATDIVIADSGDLSGPFLFQNLSTVAISGTFSLTTVVTITHGASFENSSFNATLEVAEPYIAPPIVLGMMLLTANLVARRRRRR
jgi:hypothetical protein